jgi:ribose transport system substrate-binding protein
VVTIGLSLPQEEGVYYEALFEGASQAADELNADLVVVNAEDDLETEAENVQALIDQGVDAILINPVDSVESLDTIALANDAEIPVFVVGETLDLADADVTVVSQITGDSLTSGTMAGDVMCEALSDGTVLELISAAADPESDTLTPDQTRSEGFNTYMADECGDVTITTLDTADMDHEDVVEAVSATLDGVNGVIAYNSDHLLAAVEASIIAHQNGIVFVGFEPSIDALAAVEAGQLNAIVTPSAGSLGYDSIEAVVNYLTGTDIEATIPVDLMIVNSDSFTAFRTCKRCD